MEAERHAVKLAAALESHPLVQARVIEFLEHKLKLPRRGLNKAIKAAAAAQEFFCNLVGRQTEVGLGFWQLR